MLCSMSFRELGLPHVYLAARCCLVRTESLCAADGQRYRRVDVRLLFRFFVNIVFFYLAFGGSGGAPEYTALQKLQAKLTNSILDPSGLRVRSPGQLIGAWRVARGM